MADASGRRSSPWTRWRPWLRALHRDAGYLAVGFTFTYALSGLAVNHITDWSDGDASFATYERVHELDPLVGDDATIESELRRRLEIAEEPIEIARVSEDELEILYDARTLHANTRTGQVVEEGQRPRFLLRAANWLHLNRGKQAWTYVADAYAAGLLFLATSGLFMIAGRKGLIGRGAILVTLGIAIPIAYVQLAGP